MNKFFIIFPLFFISITASAQDSIQIQENTLNAQMTEAFDKSNSFQEYKVVKKTTIASLKRNILDSVATLEKKIRAQENELGQHKNEIDSLRQNLTNTQQNLVSSKEKEDGIRMLGILTSKTVYNTIMWSIILILLAISGFLFYRFLHSNKSTNAAQLNMAEMEIELEDYRRNSLEREQKLRRKLQDEINKNRKV